MFPGKYLIKNEGIKKNKKFTLIIFKYAKNTKCSKSQYFDQSCRTLRQLNSKLWRDKSVFLAYNNGHV